MPGRTSRPSYSRDRGRADQGHAVRTALVAAISGRGMTVRRLSEGNQLVGGPVPWSYAAGLRPYVVCLGNQNGRLGTVALDFDAKRGAHGEADRQARMVMDLFDAAGFPAVLASSGPTGGRHVFLAVGGHGLQVSAGRALVERLAKLGLSTLDPTCMSSTHSAIRPPGAPHRHGGRSTVVGSWSDALDRLRRDRPDSPRASDLHEFIDALAGPSDIRAPLQRPAGHQRADAGDQAPASGSELLQRYATKVVNAGGGIGDLQHLIAGLAADNWAVRHLAKKSPAAQGAALARSIRSAERFLAEHPAVYQGHVDDDAVLAAWHELDLAAVPAPLGPVAVAMRTEARSGARRLIAMSTRTLAERSGLSEPSARRGLNQAVAARMLEVADAGRGTKARRYRLNPPELWTEELRDAVGPSPFTGGVRMPTASPTAASAALARDVGNEVWYSDALGHGVRVVYLALGDLSADGHPVPTSALAAHIGKGIRQVRDDLALLARHGLARRLGRAGWVPEYRDPREITDALGVTGLAEQRRQQHADQRLADRLRLVKHRLRKKFDVDEQGAPQPVSTAGRRQAMAA